MQFRCLNGEGPLEKETATHSNILAWKIPWIKEPGGLQSVGLQKSQTPVSTHTGICMEAAPEGGYKQLP